MRKKFCFELFESALAEKGLLPYHFTQKAGFSPGVITNMKKAKTIRKPEILRAIKEITGRPYEAFLIPEDSDPLPLYDEEQQEHKQHNHNKEWPVIGSSRGGEFLDVIENSEYTGFAESWEPLPEGCKGLDPNGFAIKLVGDSMDPKLPPGSILFIAPNIQPQNGEIALVIIEGRLGRESCVKVVYRTEKGIKLHSINEKYPEKEIEDQYVIATYKVIGYRVTQEGVL